MSILQTPSFCLTKHFYIILDFSVQCKGPCTSSPKFSYSSSFPIKMLVTDAKTQKIEPDLNFFMTDERFRRSEKRD